LVSNGKNGRLLIREIPTNPLGVSCDIWNIFGITFEPETLETQSKNARNSIKGSKNAYSHLETTNIVSQNIGPPHIIKKLFF